MTWDGLWEVLDRIQSVMTIFDTWGFFSKEENIFKYITVSRNL